MIKSGDLTLSGSSAKLFRLKKVLVPILLLILVIKRTCKLDERRCRGFIARVSSEGIYANCVDEDVDEECRSGRLYESRRTLCSISCHHCYLDKKISKNLHRMSHETLNDSVSSMQVLEQ